MKLHQTVKTGNVTLMNIYYEPHPQAWQCNIKIDDYKTVIGYGSTPVDAESDAKSNLTRDKNETGNCPTCGIKLKKYRKYCSLSCSKIKHNIK